MKRNLVNIQKGILGPLYDGSLRGEVTKGGVINDDFSRKGVQEVNNNNHKLTCPDFS